MKQAKFALTAVAVLAVIGGALAFKANRAGRIFYTETTTTTIGGDQTTLCTFKTTLPYLTTNVGSQFLHASTAPTSVACPDIKVIDNL